MRWRRPLILTVVLVGALGASCTGSSPEVVTQATLPTTSLSPAQPGELVPFAVPALGLTFELPASFVESEGQDLLFVARSSPLRALVTVGLGTPDVVDYTPDPGETMTSITVSDRPAVTVTGVVIDGLPAGVLSNDLFVDNGPRSFSLIMSASATDLPGLWEPFLASAAIAP